VWLGRAIPVSASGWPWVIFAINVSGSFLLGLVVALLRDRRPRSYGLPLLGAGFCGAYTTFSTMLVELLTMIERDRFALAGGYLFASVGAGYAAIAIANHLARRLPVSG
jgi:CrcB protein